jgi:MoxR-like ATPase
MIERTVNAMVSDVVDLASPDDLALADRMKAGRQAIVQELKKVIIGQDEVIGQVLMTLFVGGNSLTRWRACST